MENSEKCLLFQYKHIQKNYGLFQINMKVSFCEYWILRVGDAHKSAPQPTSVHNISLTQDAFKTFKEQINHSYVMHKQTLLRWAIILQWLFKWQTEVCVSKGYCETKIIPCSKACVKPTPFANLLLNNVYIKKSLNADQKTG